MISGQYSAIQPVGVGSVVQLVFNQENFVMLVYDLPDPGPIISDTSIITNVGILGLFVVTVRQQNRGTIVIETYNSRVLVWSQLIFALDITDIDLIVTDVGVAVSMITAGVVNLPNNTNITDGYSNLIVTFDLPTGVVTGTTTLTGTTGIKLGYDRGLEALFFFGITTGILSVNDVPLITDQGEDLYSFAILLSPGMAPTRFITVNMAIPLFASFDGNFLYNQVLPSTVTVLTYVPIDPTQVWITSLGVLDVQEIEMYPDFIAVVGLDIFGVPHIIRLTYTGAQLDSAQPWTSTQNIITLATQVAVGPTKFILYLLTEEQGQKFLYEYDFANMVIVWRISVPLATNLIAGSVELVAAATLQDLSIFTKRLPAVFGMVSQVLWPAAIPPSEPDDVCPPGFHQGNPGDCPEGVVPCCLPNNILPNGQLPYIVIVDFLLTEALAPVIPAQEYFLGPNGLVTTDSSSKIYIGTALDTKRLLMLTTGNWGSFI